MPIISRFYGITIKMYFSQSEHNPPHIHATYGDNIAALIIADGSLLEGHLPPKALSMVREWIKENRKDLMHIWNSQEFKALKPLE